MYKIICEHCKKLISVAVEPDILDDVKCPLCKKKFQFSARIFYIIRIKGKDDRLEHYFSMEFPTTDGWNINIKIKDGIVGQPLNIQDGILIRPLSVIPEAEFNSINPMNEYGTVLKSWGVMQ